MKYCEYGPQDVFITLHFIPNLRMGPSECYIKTRLEKLARDKHSSLLGPFIGYEENELLWVRPQDLFITLHFITNLYMGPITSLEKLSRDKHSNLLEPFIGYEENEVLWIQPQVPYLQHFMLFLTYEWVQ